MGLLSPDLVTAAECGKTCCYLSEFLRLNRPTDEKILSRQVAGEVLHWRWVMLAVFGGLAPKIFDEFVGLRFGESLCLGGVKPVAFEIYDHEYTMFGGAVREDYLIAMLGCQVVFVTAVRESK